MKNKKSFLYLIVLAAMFASCQNEKTSHDKLKASAQGTLPAIVKDRYAIDTKESRITWKGSMLFAAKGQHVGYAFLSGGDLLLEKDKLLGGTFIVDMNTLADKDHGSENDLIRHLKSADFFDVEKFPTSTFAITNIKGDGKDLQVTGILTIKGITNTVTFPAQMQLDGKVANATGKVTIDRTLWDVRYKSGKFYDNLADEAISDDIELEVKIVARR